MKDSDPIIPLFPLSLVVFPGHLVPLHIFEERYKKMVADCATAGGDYRPFGISLEQDGRVLDIGCAVTVTRVTEKYEDGSFDVVCRARSRYRTVEAIDDGPYLRGRVEYFEDSAEAVDPALQALVKERFRRLVDLAAAEAGTQILDGEGAKEAAAKGLEEGDSWAIAQRMGLEPGRKQRLLEMRSENARLQHLADYLEELLPVLVERMERKRRVKSNGHTHEV